MKQTLSKRKWKEYGWGYLMIFPLMAGMGVFYFYPVFKVFRDSLYEVGAFGKSRWVGMDNYQKMIEDAKMWQSLGNTFKYVLIIVPATVILAMILASFLNMKIKGRSFFRVVYFIPSITMGVVVAMVWRWLYNSDFGLINFVLNRLGMSTVPFLSDPRFSLIAISIVCVWSNVGYNMVILLAGLQGISRTYYESAALDGAGGIQQFFHITLPLVTPTLFFVLITTLINTFQIFDVIYMMINEKSLSMEASQSMVVYFYRNAFVFSKKGYASALAVLLFAIIMFLTVIQFAGQKKWVHYD